jgi:hypothetical protein
MVGLPNGHDNRGMKGGFATCLLSKIAREREGKIAIERPTNRQFGNAQLILMQSGEQRWEWKLMIANVPE